MQIKLTAFLFLDSITINHAQTKVSYIQTDEFAKQALPFSHTVQVDNIF